MDKIDKIVFGDNQFFGINHMSQEKAQQLSEKFFDLKSILKIYDDVFRANVKAAMLNSNDRSADICEYFRQNQDKYHDINWYPSIPYPHKYANLIAEKGIISTINELLFRNNKASGVFNIIARGGSAIFTRDLISIMQMLIDLEMKIFRGLNVKVIFLQNIITDLLLGYNFKEIFLAYNDYIKNKYNVKPGFITQNLPLLHRRLNEWNIENVVLCTSFNKIGYLMSPNIDSYIKTIKNNDSSIYEIMVMSTLASGAIPAKEAYNFINEHNVQSVVFGASTKKHINETISLIS